MAAREAPGPPLFETKVAGGGPLHRAFSLTMVASICSIWAYRFLHLPAAGQPGRYAWIGMFSADLIFGLYWIITQSARWRVVHRYPFKDRLSLRYAEDKLPAVDAFVCTADPTMEPPSMVINTVLSVMAYNYPPEKLSVYLSDDGGSDLTYYALLEASNFAKVWIPFCKKHDVEPRSPERYFSLPRNQSDESGLAQKSTDLKEAYDKIKSRIDSAVRNGCVPEEFRDRYRGFSEWNSEVTKQDHQPIVQILIDGWNPEAVDAEGNRLPTLVYISREKRPGWPHNFKAGAMNALIRVSGEISNAPVILNVDCDMYSSDPDAVREALCFFLDEEHGQRTSYVQHPQNYYNLVKDDVYANINYTVNSLELSGLDGCGGALYVGTGCFHRRESLAGKKYSGSHKIECHNVEDIVKGRTVEQLEDAAKALVVCRYEKGSLWGKEMGLVYGCPVEDIVTGLTIQCRGWRPVFYNPSKHGFEGIAPTTLDVSLIQFKRWSEGMFQVFVSRYCPFIYGRGKISLGAQMGYCIYLLWAPVSLPALCYTILPAISLIRTTPLFPEPSDLWFLPFAYFLTAKTIYNLVEGVILGDTVRGWWNLQRMILIRRSTAFFFAFVDTFRGQLGFGQMSFSLTAKVEDDMARKRYEQGMIEFGGPSTMLTIIATLALLNLLGLGWGIHNALNASGKFVPQLGICGAIVLLNLPVYEVMLWRQDAGRIPSSVVLKATAIVAAIVCIILVC